MNRDEVMEIVKECIADAVEDIDVENLDTSQSMRDHGLNSLDIVEVVSRSMRTMRVKVPRSQLNKLENIDGLVDMLFQAAAEKEGGS